MLYIMLYLIYIAFIYLLITSAILLRNRQDFLPLMPESQKFFEGDAPMVSLCIPARNEEQNIERCVRSAMRQTYPNMEVIVLDDHSSDRTSEILFRMANSGDNSLHMMQGKSKPDQWLGKPWACQQLAEEASGEILIFIDADTWLEKEMVARVVRTMGSDVLDFLTVWPQQKLGTFWEKTVIPLVYYALLSLLPVRYVQQTPHWLPRKLRKRLGPLFAAANGQCMAFKSSAYQAVGGHASVKDQVIEDVALAKRIKKFDFNLNMYHGMNAITCRMYTSGKELREGFSKNFFAGFGYNLPLFLLMAVLHLIVYIFPFLLLPWAIHVSNIYLAFLSGLVVSVIYWHRYLLARWFDWSIWYIFLHPLGVLWFQKLGIESTYHYLSGKRPSWKGRPV